MNEAKINAKLDAIFWTLVSIYETLYKLYPHATGEIDMRIGDLRAAFDQPRNKIKQSE